MKNWCLGLYLQAFVAQNIMLIDYRVQEVNKIAESRFKEVEFLKNRLSSIYGEDWKTIPNTEIKVEDDEEVKDIKPKVELLQHVKIKEEKAEEGKFHG